ncbi:unnamed protein product [Ectocarpus sp. 12 AP-2014]
MPRSADDLLLVEVQNGNKRGVERYLAAGASIDGSPHSGEEYPPIVFAAAVGSATMIKFLVDKGADINSATWRPGAFPSGSRAIHVAVSSGYGGALDALRELIKAGADLNVRNCQGCTPLMMACRVDKEGAERVELARELLKAGVDTTLVDADGRAALHYAAYSGNEALIQALLSKGSLSTLNLATQDGKTALCVAVEFVHCGVVSLLLSAGASQRGLPEGNYPCPFRSAAALGYENILRILCSERGMDAVGGGAAVLPNSLACATRRGKARILRLLLAAEGQERQEHWARRRLVLGRPLVYLAAAYGILANVKVLLAAGADETDTDPDGYAAPEVIGGQLPSGSLDPLEAAAIGRELQRGPAYRACSWAWPVGEDAPVVGDVGAAGALRGLEITTIKMSTLCGKLVQRYCQKL